MSTLDQIIVDLQTLSDRLQALTQTYNLEEAQTLLTWLDTSWPSLGLGIHKFIDDLIAANAVSNYPPMGTSRVGVPQPALQPPQPTPQPVLQPTPLQPTPQPPQPVTLQQPVSYEPALRKAAVTYNNSGRTLADYEKALSNFADETNLPPTEANEMFRQYLIKTPPPQEVSAPMQKQEVSPPSRSTVTAKKGK